MKHSLITTAIVFVSTFSYGQIRHVKGIKAFEANVFASEFGTAYGLSYVTYLNSKLYVKAGALFEEASSQELETRSYTVDGTVNYSLFNIKETVYFNASGGLTFTFDQLLESENLASQDVFKYGFIYGGEIETFITDKLVLVARADSRFLFRDEFGNSRYYLGGGIRYSF